MLDIIRALRVLKRQITMHSIENVPNYREKYQVLHNLQPVSNFCFSWQRLFGVE